MFRDASISVPDSCIDGADRVSRTDDTVRVRFTTFRHHPMFYRKSNELKNGVKVHLDLTKARINLLIKASKYVNSLSDVGFVHANVNCRLKIHLSNNSESFFDSLSFQLIFSCLLIQLIFTSFVLKWYAYWRCQWKKIYKGDVLQVLTGSARNMS